jgi:hypothetical protein
MEPVQNAYILGRNLTGFKEMGNEETDLTNLFRTGSSGRKEIFINKIN